MLLARSEGAISKKKDSRKANKSGALAGALRWERPAARVRDYDAHVLVCKGGDCKKRGAKGIREALKGGLRSAGMNGDIRVDSVDCFGLCKHGPNVVVYPSGTWYLGLAEAEVPEIIERHLKGGAPVERLAVERRDRRKKAKS